MNWLLPTTTAAILYLCPLDVALFTCYSIVKIKVDINSHAGEDHSYFLTYIKVREVEPLSVKRTERIVDYAR